MTDWVILRCSGRSTIGLAESLAVDGFEVWSPVETRSVRIPRANARRQVRLPIMPSYVFARSHHLIDLLQLANMPVKPRRGAGLRDAAHADFSVMHFSNKIPVVAERDLAGLRRLEAKRTPVKRAAYSFPRNAATRVTGGPFEGIVGTVASSNERRTKLDFTMYGKTVAVEIPTTMLELSAVQMEMAA